MFDIASFVNIRRKPMTAWTLVLKNVLAGAYAADHVKAGCIFETITEFFSGITPDGAAVFSVRKTLVSGAGGFPLGTAEFADKLDALDAYNAAIGTYVDVQEIAA